MPNLAGLVHFPTMVSVSGVMTELRKGESVKGALINTFDKAHDYGVAVAKEHAMVAFGATVPLLMGTGPVLGVGPSSEYTCLIYISPVSSYHKGALNLVVEDKLYRAIPGGTGGVKAVTKYSPLGYLEVIESRDDEIPEKGDFVAALLSHFSLDCFDGS
ncbi:Branched-chain-amino-acid aminotransferase [Quillaja saponaria]|uniref:Branched-chain-amino-acid aminotransferase n=1 Tax=Quillaja saponaria TaxID=32244 RepID=A0AAD7PVG5_QUISA|nr:Branched-chain-amino-acid aminotransferase [Quillaja saponaria]